MDVSSVSKILPNPAQHLGGGWLNQEGRPTPGSTSDQMPHPEHIE